MHCLDALFNELTCILYNRNDPQRLNKCQRVLESYRGTDWILHSTIPEIKGFQIYGYSRAQVRSQPDLFSLLILTWSPKSRSAIHNHPCERCFLMPLQGDLSEVRYSVVEEGPDQRVREIGRDRIPQNKACWIDDSHGWHAIVNDSHGLSVSLHLYIPSFTKCKIVDPSSHSIRWVNCFPTQTSRFQPLHERVFDTARNYLKSLDCPASRPVIKLRTKCDIEEIFNEKCSLEFSDNAAPMDDDSILAAVQNTCDFSTNTGHLYFFNQLFARADPLAVAADCLSNCLNANLLTFEMAPVFLLMEKRLLQHMASFLGWYTHFDPNSQDNDTPQEFSLCGDRRAPSPAEQPTAASTTDESAPNLLPPPADTSSKLSEASTDASQSPRLDAQNHPPSTRCSAGTGERERCGHVGDVSREVVPSVLVDRLRRSDRKLSAPFETFDGLLNPGGAISNVMALNVARHHIVPEVKVKGVYGTPPLVIFTSEQGHESIEKATALLGLGVENVVHVPVLPSTNAMDPQALAHAVQQAADAGKRPFFVNCTAATTVAGAFDPFEAIRDVCDEWGMWMHVDGAVGASFLLPQEEYYKKLCRGMDRADSVSWNLHKLLGVPLQCSALLTRHPGLLSRTHSTVACPNLFSHIDTPLCDLDSCCSTFQYGRRADAFKAWCLWKKLGDQGMANRIRLVYTHTMELAELIRTFPKKFSCPGRGVNLPTEVEVEESVPTGMPSDINQDAFHLVWEPVSCNCCFWWVPYDLRKPFAQHGWQHPLLHEHLIHVAPAMKRQMLTEGSIMVDYHTLAGRPFFWRLPLVNPDICRDDIFNVLRIINRIGTSCFPPGSYAVSVSEADLSIEGGPMWQTTINDGDSSSCSRSSARRVASFPGPEMAHAEEIRESTAALPSICTF